jgi:hypothetical protein
MKICQTHWDQLKEAINQKGMSHLISKSGEELADRLKKEINKELTTYDPLMAANLAIAAASIKDAGIGIMGLDENENPYCPLCEVDKHLEEGAKDWIEGSTDDCLEYCKNNNLLNKN